MDSRDAGCSLLSLMSPSFPEFQNPWRENNWLEGPDFSVFVHVDMCICACVWAHMYVCVCICKSEEGLRYGSLSTSTLFGEAESLTRQPH